MMRYLIDDNVASLDMCEALKRVSVQRRDKALRYHSETQRRESVAAYLLLCRLLSEEYGIEAYPTFDEATNGKPFLADYPHIHFNLSHTRGVADAPVGIDVERIRRYNDILARRVLSEKEYGLLCNAAEKNVEFIRMWTMKESLLKLTGEGIRRELSEVDIHDGNYTFVTTIDYEKQYVCTVCERRKFRD